MGRWATWATGGQAFGVWGIPGLVNIQKAIEHGPFIVGLPIKNVIFNSYVSLPEAIPRLGFCFVLTQDWCTWYFGGKPTENLLICGSFEENPPQLDTWKFLIFCRQPTDSPAKGWRGCRGPPIDKCDPLGPTLASRKRKSAVESAIVCVYYVSDWWFGTFFIFPYIGNNNPNWIILFRGPEATNQYIQPSMCT